MNKISDYCIPVILALILLTSLFKKKSPFDSFCKGASKGLSTAASIFPSILGIIVAIEFMNESGFMNFFASLASPFFSIFGVDKEIVPLALIRPISGSGSTALLGNLLERFSPDSYIGRSACVIAAGTETTFYTIAVYFAATNVKKMRHTVICALMADMVCIIVGSYICKVMF
ncbi:MAG: nucleoside recognition domain-containing protein [Clostridia bacterium]|nr:nucleoside recognition domain-containing protein [Clostridia bacterium]